METSGYIALSRQMALQNHMEVLAHNVANANTTGFLGDDMTFQAVLSRVERGRDIAFVQDLTPKPDLADGEFRVTGGPLDFAIGNYGFFAVETPDGVRYTRAGHFHLNEDNQIVTSDGHPVLGADDGPIELPGDVTTLTVAKDGTLSVEGEVVGQFQRVQFAEPERLERQGGMLLKTDEVPEIAVNSEVIQGSLENSNVDPILSMVAMMKTTRAFQTTQKIIETQHELTRNAVQRLLDVQS